MRVRIRGARPADAAGIARVHVETWRLAYAGLVPDRHLLELTVEAQRERWRRQIARPGAGEVLVADGGGAGILGFGSSGSARHPQALASAEVYTLYVAGDYQGLGLGRGLLCQLLRGLHRRGHRAAYLWVLADNPARFFYQAMGGRPAGRQRDAFAGALLPEEAYLWPDLAAWLTEQAQGDSG